MITETKVIKLIESHLAGSETFLVDASVKPGNLVSVYIDGDHGISIETCRELNNFLNESLDRDTEDFALTVSSAGADRPLKLPRQYKKNISKALEVVTKTGEKISGVVIKADETGFELEVTPMKKSGKDPEHNMVSLQYCGIKSAKEVITFKP